jgi:hypothetical protein
MSVPHATDNEKVARSQSRMISLSAVYYFLRSSNFPCETIFLFTSAKTPPIN